MNGIAQAVELASKAVNPVVLPFAILCGLVLAAVALNFVTLARVKVMIGKTAQEMASERARYAAELKSLRDGLTNVSVQVREIRQEPGLTSIPAPPKPGFNLSKRSQVLRMHRRGDAPVQIAAALDIPLQEIDLLLKVHRIVIGNI